MGRQKSWRRLSGRRVEDLEAILTLGGVRGRWGGVVRVVSGGVMKGGMTKYWNRGGVWSRGRKGVWMINRGGGRRVRGLRLVNRNRLWLLLFRFRSEAPLGQ